MRSGPGSTLPPAPGSSPREASRCRRITPTEPYAITRKLIEDGRERLVLRAPLALPFSVRLLQGSADTDVPVSLALRLLEHVDSPDLRLTIVKGADHRFSAPENLDLLARTLDDLR